MKINVAVLVQNTHNNDVHYYGPQRVNMVVGPIPENVRFIRDCITTARGGDGQDAPQTIVVLPEFILQPYEGAYTAAQRTVVNNHMQTILDNTPNNVLVVFGTVVSENGSGGQFYNDMLYGIGGGNLRHTGKHELSNIDLIDGPIANVIGWNAGVLNKNALVGDNVWNQSPNQNHVVNFRGKRIGFSVCLDYYLGVLRNRTANPVDIHIVASCGMQFYDSNSIIDGRRFGDINYCNNFGKVVVCDAEGEWSSVHQVNQYGQSKQRSSMLTTESAIRGIPTKIRRTQMTVPD